MILYFFKSEKCIPCKAVFPKLKQLLQTFPNIELIVIDILNQPELSGQFLVFTSPFIVVTKDDKEIARFSGLLSIEVIREKLNILAKNYEDTSEL